MSNVKDAQERAIRLAAREERARDAARALQDLDAERRATIAKTARLRELRLAGTQIKTRQRKPTKG